MAKIKAEEVTASFSPDGLTFVVSERDGTSTFSTTHVVRAPRAAIDEALARAGYFRIDDSGAIHGNWGGRLKGKGIKA